MTADDAGRGSLRNLWPRVGKLEANVDRLLEGQTQLKADLKDTNDRIDRKFDRLMYAVVALTTGVIGLLILELVSRVGSRPTPRNERQKRAADCLQPSVAVSSYQTHNVNPQHHRPRPAPRATGRVWKLAAHPLPATLPAVAIHPTPTPFAPSPPKPQPPPL